jgi:hypothetical protein
MVGIRKALLRLTRSCRENALALASLSIAAMGLYLTITSQSEERAHKELLIRPVLQFALQVSNFSVGVVNAGLGPALITDTVYFFDGQCRSANRKNLDLFLKTDFVDVHHNLGQFFVPQFAALGKGDWKSTQGFGTVLPIPTQIVATGQVIDFFKLDSDLLAEVNSKLSELKLEVRQAFLDEFVRHSQSVPVRIRYCSMSERYCSSSTIRDLPCQFDETT